MQSADNLRRALELLKEFRALLWKTPHETIQSKFGNKFPLPVIIFVEDDLDGIEEYVLERLRHVEVVGRVKADSKE